MKIKTATIDKLLLIYLFFPLILFLLTWLNITTSIISLISAITILIVMLREIPSQDFFISKRMFYTAAGIVILWCILAGIGGLYYQSPDWHTRNALFHDIVNFSYPVYYDNGTTLVYYMFFLLPGAITAKFASFLGAAPDTAFKIGNLMTLFYSSIGVFLIYLEICILTKAQKLNQLWALLIFIFFSGLDVFVPHNVGEFAHIERHGLIQYSSNTTLLFWVYNPAIPAWAVTTLLLKRPFNISNYGIIAALGLFYAPLPFIGLAIYMFWLGCVKAFRELKTKHFKKLFMNIFSIKNILALGILFPIIYFYFKSNNTAANESWILSLPLLITPIFYKFLFWEAGIYMLFVNKLNKKNPLFNITVLSLFLIPLIRIGWTNTDFGMRASIPALFILMVLVIKYLFSQQINRTLKTALVIVLLLGTITPAIEFYRGFYITFHATWEPLIKDDIKTYNNKIYPENCGMKMVTRQDSIINPANYCNYGSLSPEKTIFYNLFAKKRN